MIRSKHIRRRLQPASLILVVLLAAGPAAGCREMRTGRQAEKMPAGENRFVPPTLPMTLTAPDARADYLALHRWDGIGLAGSTPPQTRR